MGQKKCMRTELEVFTDKAAKANLAIFVALIKETHQNSKQLLRQISKQKGLEELYYASLTKRLHCLQKTGYVREAKPTEPDSKSPTCYELRIKAYLAMFLKENSMQDILDQATDTQAALILLTLLNVFQTGNEN